MGSSVLCLATIVLIVFVAGQTMAEQQEQCFILESATEFRADELPDRIISKFEQLNLQKKKAFVVAYEFGKLLAKTINKNDQLDILGGLSVNQMLALNTWIVPGDCNEVELDRRAAICDKLKRSLNSPTMFQEPLKSGPLKYCYTVLFDMRARCWNNELKGWAYYEKLFGLHYGGLKLDGNIMTRPNAMARRDKNHLRLACLELVGKPKRHYFKVMDDKWRLYYNICEKILGKN